MFSFLLKLYWFFWIQLADGYGHRNDHKSQREDRHGHRNDHRSQREDRYGHRNDPKSQREDKHGHINDYKSQSQREIDEKYKIDLKRSREEAAERAREKARARAKAEEQSEHEHHGVKPEYTADRTGGTHKKLELPRHKTSTGERYEGGYAFGRGEPPKHPEPTFLRTLGKMFCVII